MTTNQHRISIRVGIDGSLKPFGKVLLERGVFNNRNSQRIVIVVHSLSFSFGNTLNLLDIADLEVALLSVFALHQQCHKHSPLRVCMDAASGPALECREE